MLKISPKALHFRKILGGGPPNPPPPPEKRAPNPPPPPNTGLSPPLLFHTTTKICHSYRFIISVYISNIFASLVVQF